MNRIERLRSAGVISAATPFQLVAVAGLVIDAKIHWNLATTYDAINGGTITQGGLFRLEAVLAVVAAVGVLVSRRAMTALVAVAVAGGGLVPLLVYRYIDVGAIGPIPDMYEPAWFPDKTTTCIAQAIAAGAGLVLLLMAVVRTRRSRSDA